LAYVSPSNSKPKANDSPRNTQAWIEHYATITF